MEHSNMCCSVDLDVDRGLRAIVKAQKRFRQRRVKAIVIQRTVRKWMQCKKFFYFGFVMTTLPLSVTKPEPPFGRTTLPLGVT